MNSWLRLDSSLDLGQRVRGAALQAAPAHRLVVLVDGKHVVVGVHAGALQIDLPLGLGHHPQHAILELAALRVEGAVLEYGHAAHPFGVVLRRGGPLTDQSPHEVDDDQQQLGPLCDAELSELLGVVARLEGHGAQAQGHLVVAGTKRLRHALPKLGHARAREETGQRLRLAGQGGDANREWLLVRRARRATTRPHRAGLLIRCARRATACSHRAAW
mmetsp:Transcript_43627/g.112745  ORF Transcript_43627/g.112745 Transcript_43627/m.112745 type:complete len:217 (-) Transcript_43627:108-758(-)